LGRGVLVWGVSCRSESKSGLRLDMTVTHVHLALPDANHHVALVGV